MLGEDGVGGCGCVVVGRAGTGTLARAQMTDLKRLGMACMCVCLLRGARPKFYRLIKMGPGQLGGHGMLAIAAEGRQ